MDQSEVRRSGEESVGLHVVTHGYGFQVDALERNAFEVLRLVRYIKNTFAPTNRLPHEVLSIIPDYLPEERLDRTTIQLSHVCRRWRDTFISRPSLWTNFSFKDIDKTRTYIHRSRSSPLNISISYPRHINDAFSLIIPHIHRLKSLTIIGTDAFPRILTHFRCHSPLLENLDLSSDGGLEIDGALFNGDLSLLRKLRLNQIIIRAPWKTMKNLRVFELRGSSYGITQILDFLESAPFLHTISLELPELPSSDAPIERIVPLRHLKVITIESKRHLPILLHHLHIPTGASLIAKFFLYGVGGKSPLLDYLTRRSVNFSNLSDITAINIHHDDSTRTFVRLSGPSGSLRLIASWWGTVPYTVERQSYRFLDPILPTTRRLTISEIGQERKGQTKVKDCPTFRTLSSANNLRTLVLISCDIQRFTRALDPEQNPSNLVLCPDMEELVIYLRFSFLLDFDRLISMAKSRASGGAMLSSVTFVDVNFIGEIHDLSRLREHVTHVKWIQKCPSSQPTWDWVPGEGVSTGD
jgi:hypothetical protein